MMRSFEKIDFPCPKCGQTQGVATPLNQEDDSPKEGDYSICYNCGQICKFTMLGILEEVPDFQVDLLPEENQQILRKMQRVIVELKSGKLKVTPKIILETANAIGTRFAADIASTRDGLKRKGFLNGDIIDNIILQSVVRQLAVLISCATNKNGKAVEDEEVRRIQNPLNVAIEKILTEMGHPSSLFNIKLPNPNFKEDDSES